VRKTVVLLVAISSVFMFRLALQRYDTYVFNSITVYASEGETTLFLGVSGEISEDEVAGFQSTFMGLLDKYDLDCYQSLVIDSDHILWAYTDDERYLSEIPLTNGTLTSISPGDYLFSNDASSKGTIYNPIRNENFKIYHLNDFSNSSKSIFGTYQLLSHSKHSSTVYSAFVSDIKEQYPSLEYKTIESEMHGAELSTIDYRDMVFASLTAALAILSLNAFLSKRTKSIQLIKLEGYGSLSVFSRLALLQILSVVAVNIAISSMLFFLVVETDIRHAMSFVTSLLAGLAVFSLVLLLLCTITFAVIISIGPNLAVKGKNHLRQWKKMNYILSVLIFVSSASYLLDSLDNLVRMGRVVSSESKYLEQLDDLYMVSHIKPQYLGTMSGSDTGADTRGNMELVSYLRENNNFFFVMSYGSFSVTSESNNINIVFASKEYVQQFISKELSSQMSDDINYVLVPSSLEESSELVLKNLNQMFPSFNGSLYNEALVYSRYAISIEPHDFIQYGITVDNTVIIVQPKRSIDSYSYFYYQGSTEQAQEYFDALMMENGIPPRWSITSISEQYQEDKAYFIQVFRDDMVVFALVIIAIIANAYHLAVLNCEADGKRHAVVLAEGHVVFSLVADEIISCAIALLAGTVLFMFFTGISITRTILLVFIFLPIIVIVLLRVTSKLCRSFANRLR